MVAAVPETAGYSRRKSAAVRQNEVMSANIRSVTNHANAKASAKANAKALARPPAKAASAPCTPGTPARPGTAATAKIFARSPSP